MIARLIQLCLKDKILNFEKINKILDSYLQVKKAEIDKKRKQNPVALITSLLKTAANHDKKDSDAPRNTLGTLLVTSLAKAPEKKPAPGGLLGKSLLALGKKDQSIVSEESKLALKAGNGKSANQESAESKSAQSPPASAEDKSRSAGRTLFASLARQKPKKEVDFMQTIKADVERDDLKRNNTNLFSAVFSMTNNKIETVGGKAIFSINRRPKGETLEIFEYLKRIDNGDRKSARPWYFAVFFTIVDFVIALLPVMQLEYFKSGEVPLNFYLICEFLNVIALLDPLISHQYDPKLINKRSSRFKLLVTLLLIVLSNIMQLVPVPLESTEVKANKSCYYVWCGVSLLKIASVHEILKFSSEYRLILETITQIVPLLGDLFIQVVLLVLFYGVVGVLFFGGRITTQTPKEYEDMVGNNMENNYEYLTFNDIPSGLLFLYSIMITNDWSKMMTGAILTYKSIQAIAFCRLFFLSFFVLGLMLVLNTTIGAIIDFINTYLSILKDEEDAEAEEQAASASSVSLVSNTLFGIDQSKQKEEETSKKTKHQTKKAEKPKDENEEEETRKRKKIERLIFPDD